MSNGKSWINLLQAGCLLLNAFLLSILITGGGTSAIEEQKSKSRLSSGLPRKRLSPREVAIRQDISEIGPLASGVLLSAADYELGSIVPWSLAKDFYAAPGYSLGPVSFELDSTHLDPLRLDEITREKIELYVWEYRERFEELKSENTTTRENEEGVTVYKTHVPGHVIGEFLKEFERSMKTDWGDALGVTIADMLIGEKAVDAKDIVHELTVAEDDNGPYVQFWEDGQMTRRKRFSSMDTLRYVYGHVIGQPPRLSPN